MDLIVSHLSKYDLDKDKIRLCANLSGGSIGTALENLRSGRLQLRDQALELLQTLPRKPYHQLTQFVNEQESPESLFYLLRSLFTDLIYLQAGIKNRVANFDICDQLQTVLKSYSKDSLKTCIKILNDLYSKQALIKATFSSHLKIALLQIKRSISG